MNILTRPFRIIVILLAALAVFLFGIILFCVPHLRAETARIKGLRGPLETQAAVLEQDVAAVREQALAEILTEHFTAQELSAIGLKFFVYELRVNGMKIDRSNIQVNSMDSFLEITVTESMVPGDFPEMVAKNLSMMNFSKISVHSTTSPYTAKTKYFKNKTIVQYSFPRIEVGEIITIGINDPGLAAAFGLEENVIEITHSYEE